VSGRSRRIGLLVLPLALAAGCVGAPARPVAPLSAEEHNDLGVAYYHERRYDAAVREFRRAIELRPGLTRARTNLGDALLAGGAIDAAIAAYEGARAADPEDPAIANNLAWALLQHERRWPEAEPLVMEALARGPRRRGYYLDTLGVLLLRKGELRAALEAFRSALADGGLAEAAARGSVLRHAADALARLGNGAAAEHCRRLAERLAAPAPLGGTAAQVGGNDTVC
jgi:tetratricopeptide (TPR) repeat protein